VLLGHNLLSGHKSAFVRHILIECKTLPHCNNEISLKNTGIPRKRSNVYAQQAAWLREVVRKNFTKRWGPVVKRTPPLVAGERLAGLWLRRETEAGGVERPGLLARRAAAGCSPAAAGASAGLLARAGGSAAAGSQPPQITQLIIGEGSYLRISG